MFILKRTAAIGMKKGFNVNRTLQIVIGLISIGLALAAGFYGRATYLQEVSTIQIPVPARPLPAYAVLQADMFQLREVPRAMQSLPYHQSLPELVGRITTVALPAGLPVACENAIPVAQFRLADAALEVISIPVQPVSAVGGQIRIGQRVNLYQVLSHQDSSNLPAAPIAERSAFQVEPVAGSVLVVDVRNAQGVSAEANARSEASATFGPSPQTEQVQILTLAVHPAAVQDILNAVASAQKQGGLLWTTLAIP